MVLGSLLFPLLLPLSASPAHVEGAAPQDDFKLLKRILRGVVARPLEDDPTEYPEDPSATLRDLRARMDLVGAILLVIEEPGLRWMRTVEDSDESVGLRMADTVFPMLKAAATVYGDDRGVDYLRRYSLDSRRNEQVRMEGVRTLIDLSRPWIRDFYAEILNTHRGLVIPVLSFLGGVASRGHAEEARLRYGPEVREALRSFRDYVDSVARTPEAFQRIEAIDRMMLRLDALTGLASENKSAPKSDQSIGTSYEAANPTASKSTNVTPSDPAGKRQTDGNRWGDRWPVFILFGVAALLFVVTIFSRFLRSRPATS